MPILTTIANAAAKGFGFGSLVAAAAQVYKKIVVVVKNQTSQSTASQNIMLCATYDFASNYQSSPTNTNNNFIAYGGQYQWSTNGTTGQPFLFGDMALVPVGSGTTTPYRQLAAKQWGSTASSTASSWATSAIVPTGTVGSYYVFGVYTNSTYGSNYVGLLSGDVYTTWNFTTFLSSDSNDNISAKAWGNSVGYANGNFCCIGFNNTNSTITSGAASIVSTGDTTTTNNRRTWAAADSAWKTPANIYGSCCVDARWLSGYGSSVGFCLPIVNVANTRTYIVTGALTKSGIFNTSLIALYNTNYSLGTEEMFKPLNFIVFTNMPIKKANYITADNNFNHYVGTVVKTTNYTPVICKLNQYANSLTETWEYTSNISDIAITAIDYIPYLDCLYVQFSSVSYPQVHYIAKVVASGASKGTVSWIKKILFGNNLGTSFTYTVKVSFNQTGDWALIPGAILSGSFQESVLATYPLDGSQDGTTIYYDNNSLTVTAEVSTVFALNTTTSSLVSSQSFTSFSYNSSSSWNGTGTITTTNYASSNSSQSTYTY